MGWNTHIPAESFSEPPSDMTDDIRRYNCHCCQTYSQAVICGKFSVERFKQLHYSEACQRCMDRKDREHDKTN